MKTCTGCGNSLITGVNWYPSNKRIGMYFCIPCNDARSVQYKRDNPSVVNKWRGVIRKRRIPLCRVHPECATIDRAEVLRRGQGICGICRRSKVRRSWHMDHIHPVSKGGIHCYYNLQPAHVRCNLRKGNKVAL